MGASAGGVEALQELAAGLPPDFPAAVCVVRHLQASSSSNLPARAGPLPACHPEDGEALRPGHIYVALPDHHLPVEPDTLGVRKGPRENRFRPAIGALSRSAAYTHVPNVIGVVLTGVLDDGTSGLWTIKRLSGTAIVQDPAEAAFDDMPRHALEQVAVDYAVGVGEMEPLLDRLVRERVPQHPGAAVSEQEWKQLGTEVGMSAKGPESPSSVTRPALRVAHSSAPLSQPGRGEPGGSLLCGQHREGEPGPGGHGLTGHPASPNTTIASHARGGYIRSINLWRRMAVEVLRVSGKSRPNSVAGAVAALLRSQGHVELHAIGPAAVNQAVKALAIARGYLVDDGLDLAVQPAFMKLDVADEERTALNFLVRGVRAEVPA